MVSSTRQRSSKRPREDHDDELNERARKRFKKLEEENRELREAMDDLKGLVECPVCLTVPRQGSPMPVCSNGHFVCLACRDQIRQAAGLEEAKCPSCMVALGSATSLIASRLVEKVEHECENDGCGKMFKLSQLGGHQDICLFRKVRCPGSGHTCKLELPFIKVEKHLEDCPDTSKVISENNSAWTAFISQDARDSVQSKFFWNTKRIVAHDRTFFLKHKKENSNHYFEALMLGSEEESMGYQASITIQKPGQSTSSKYFARNVSNPRHIDLQSWGVMGLTLPQKALSKFIIPKEGNLQYSLTLSVEKL